MTNISLPKFELKLNEESELNFKLTIEGQSPEGTPSKPEFRFIVSEIKGEHQALNENITVSTSGCKGWLYPVSCDKETDIVSIKIVPQKESGFQVGKKYHGKLEVIVGNLLMTPAEVILEFIQPLQIEATAITKNTSTAPLITVKSSIVNKSITENKLIHDEEDEEIEAVITPPTKKITQQVPKPATKKTTPTVSTSTIDKNKEKRLQEQARLKRIALLKEKIKKLISEGVIDEEDLDEQLIN